MHEMGLAEGLLEEALRHAGDGRIKKINIEVGMLSGVSAESLKFCLNAVLDERRIAGVELMTRTSPIVCVCPCGRHYLAADIRAKCPDCGQICEKVLGGRECRIEAVESAAAG
jgi:hydrogenase nickel insertion protein HypA